MVKKSLSWVLDRLSVITRSYEWNIGQIDKDAFVPVKFLVNMLQVCWRNSSSDNSTILYPTRHLLSLLLLMDNSGDFEQWACASPVYWALFFHNVHNHIAKGDRSVLEVSLRATSVPTLVRNMLFEDASVTHVRNRRRHASRPFHKAIQEKTYNNTPTVILWD